jgi:predicted DNA-binding protein
MNIITSTFRLPEELYESLRLMAFQNRISLAEVIRRACENYIALKVNGGEDESDFRHNSK